jgi:hypothetical protein
VLAFLIKKEKNLPEESDGEEFLLFSRVLTQFCPNREAIESALSEAVKAENSYLTVKYELINLFLL